MKVKNSDRGKKKITFGILAQREKYGLPKESKKKKKKFKW